MQRAKRARHRISSGRVMHICEAPRAHETVPEYCCSSLPILCDREGPRESQTLRIAHANRALCIACALWRPGAWGGRGWVAHRHGPAVQARGRARLRRLEVVGVAAAATVRELVAGARLRVQRPPRDHLATHAHHERLLLTRLQHPRATSPTYQNSNSQFSYFA